MRSKPITITISRKQRETLKKVIKRELLNIGFSLELCRKREPKTLFCNKHIGKLEAKIEDLKVILQTLCD